MESVTDALRRAVQKEAQDEATELLQEAYEYFKLPEGSIVVSGAPQRRNGRLAIPVSIEGVAMWLDSWYGPRFYVEGGSCWSRKTYSAGTPEQLLEVLQGRRRPDYDGSSDYW